MPRPRGEKRKEVEIFISSYEALHNKLPSRKEIADEIGAYNSTIDISLSNVKKERGRKNLHDPIGLSKAQKNHIEMITKIIKKKLEMQFDAKLQEGVKAYIAKFMPDLEVKRSELAHKIDAYDKMTNRFKAIFSAEEFRLILMCLHPDGERTKEKIEEAFILVKSKEKQLTKK
jgi:hypothetical protein